MDALVSYISLALSTVVAVVFYMLLSKERSSGQERQKLLTATQSEVEKLKSELHNKVANQLSLLTGELERIEKVETEQRGYFARLTQATNDAEFLRGELKETLSRLATQEEKVADFERDIAAVRSKQQKLAGGMSMDKFFMLAKTRNPDLRAELTAYLRNTITEEVLEELQPQLTKSSACIASLYVLDKSIERRNACVDAMIELGAGIDTQTPGSVVPNITESGPPRLRDWLEDILWMIENSPPEQEPTLRLFECLAIVAVKRDDLVMAQDLHVRLTRAHTKLGARVHSAPLRRGLAKLSELFERHGVRDKLETCYKRIHELALAEPGSNKAEMAQNIKKLAKLYADQDRLDEAATMYDISLNLLTQALGPEHADVIQHMRDFGRLHCELKNAAGAARIYLRLLALPAIKKYSQLVPLVDEIDIAGTIFWSESLQESLKLYIAVIDLLMAAGPNEALMQKALYLLHKLCAKCPSDSRVEPSVVQHFYEQALQSMTLLGLTASPEHREISLKLAQIYNSKQQFERSSELLEKAAHDAEQAQPSELLNLLICKAKSETGLGRYGDAETALKSFLELHPEKSELPDTEMIELFAELGVVASLMKRNEEAEEYFKKELAAVEQSFSKDSLNTVGPLLHLAQLSMSKGEWPQAIPYYERILSTKRKELGDDHAELLSTLLTLAELKRLTKNLDESRSLYQNALQVCENSFGADNVKVADVLEKFAALEEEMNSNGKSSSMLDRAERIRTASSAGAKAVVP